jgi:geranylgeranyl transferase type-2 subunit beta
MLTYLEALTLRLAEGLGRLPEEQRARHVAYVRTFQQPDGGFSGRDGGSDLYYTGFALRSLGMLGELHGDVAERAASYLRSRLSGQVAIVDFLSLIYSAKLVELAAAIDVFAGQPRGWQQAVAKALEDLRRPDGGYAKTPEGQASSVYHTFLVVLGQQLLGLPIVEPERLTKFVLGRHRDDGGFVEMTAMKRSGTNPTAAAVGLLRILNALEPAVQEAVVDFLAEMQTDEGGLRANTRIPIADLLSTFTGYLTLSDLNAAGEIDPAAIRAYAQSLEQPDGGFHGAAWDGGHDAEYTFYGLGTLALLTPHA